MVRVGMENGNTGMNLSRFSALLSGIQNSAWAETLAKVWQIGSKVLGGMASEGVYEVMDYESTLEIHDDQGTRATFRKTKMVRYLQNNVIAF